MKNFLCLILLLAHFVLFAQQTPEQVSIKAQPEAVYIEKGNGSQYLNFDFLITNASTDTLTIAGIEVSVYNKNNQLTNRKFIDGNGVAPSIKTLPERTMEGKTQLNVFNPFHTFSESIDLSLLEYEFLFTNQAKKEFRTFVKVKPTVYQTKTDLQLPVKGKVLIEDGHDFYAHHRRFNYAHPFIKSLGFKTNFMRYSYDFVLLNKNNEKYNGDSEKNESWFSFGKEIYAPASGKVVSVVDSMADNRRFDESKLNENQMILFGNYLVIDHLNGEFSLFAHAKQNSSKVKVGDYVKAGQVIAEIGASGSAFMPHLHYELRNADGHLAEGLPSYFTKFKKAGNKIKKGQIDSGDIIETE